MTILQPDDVSFSPKRMARPSPIDGIALPTASIIIREFESCPECGNDLDPDVTEATREDRDVVWKDRGHHASPHTCESCGATLGILAEEKAFGVINESQIPDDYDEDVLTFVHVPDSNAVLMVNSFQLMIGVVDGSTQAHSGEQSTQELSG